MPVQIVFETHSTTEDNEAGRATGWLPGRLSPVGRAQAAELGRRRASDGLAAIFSSDLARSLETARIAFAGSVPILADWRLRECDYGRLNGAPVAEVLTDRSSHLDEPYPGGESWRQATARVARFLFDLPLRWEGCRVLVLGHVATYWGLECAMNAAELTSLVQGGFDWQKGCEFSFNDGADQDPRVGD
ncbi:MAG TPA: histidine phosphatase family protein [Acidimicrobiales bacterium]|nr:histidine phosphatase family protein [Acidimicrobiales bacterium]